jgi:hypothetical protein
MRQRGSRHKPGKLWIRGALLLLASALLLAPPSAFAKEGKKLTKKETTLKKTKHRRARARSATEGTTEALAGGSEPFGPEPPSQPWQLEAPATLNGDGLGILNATFVASANDAWAVGSGNAEDYTALAEQWNGSRWSAVPTTDLGAPGEVSTPLYGVGGTGPDDVWAVGGDSGSPTGGLIAHWNGTSWSLAAPVSGEPTRSTLLAVSADSPSDAWAVGESSVSGAHNSWKQPLLEHFDGDEWSFVPTPEVEGGALRAISAVSPDDIWAVGAPGYEAPQLIEHTRVEHPSGLAGGPLFDVGANEDGGEGVIIEQPAP